jgi:2-phosphoglycerate kinase
MKKKIPKGFVIFINGSTGVGKTTVAWALARKYNISSIISTDIIREILRYDVDSHKINVDKVLLQSSYLAYTKLNHSEGDVVIEAFNRQCLYLLGAIISIIGRVRIKRDPVIIEGVNICAKQLFDEIPNDPYSRIFFINLYMSATAEHEKRIKLRGKKVGELPEKTDRYLKNFDSILKIDKYLKNDTLEARRYYRYVPENIVSIDNSKSIRRTVKLVSKELNNKIEYVQTSNN